jgi:hypothetical protein
MKLLMLATLTAALFVGCTSPNSGRPGDNVYREGSNDPRVSATAEPNDRVAQKSGLNLRQGWH